MGIHLKQMGANVHGKLKSSSQDLFVFAIKVFTGFMMGLTLALVGEEIIGYETLSFVLIITFITGVFLSVSRSWGLGGILIFDLVVVLFAMLLRMYILVAPGM
jgi:hypothetical protein